MPPGTLDAAELTVDVRLDVDEPAVHVQMAHAPQLPTRMSTSNRHALRNLVSTRKYSDLFSSLDAAEPTADVRLDVNEPTVHVQMVGGATPTAVGRA